MPKDQTYAKCSDKSRKSKSLRSKSEKCKKGRGVAEYAYFYTLVESHIGASALVPALPTINPGDAVPFNLKGPHSKGIRLSNLDSTKILVKRAGIYEVDYFVSFAVDLLATLPTAPTVFALYANVCNDGPKVLQGTQYSASFNATLLPAVPAPTALQSVRGVAKVWLDANTILTLQNASCDSGATAPLFAECHTVAASIDLILLSECKPSCKKSRNF